MIPPDNKLICIGHRGAAGYAPENTLLSIQKAMDLGAEWIEVDVHAVHGEIILIHDSTLNRTTSGRGNIYKKPLSLIRAVDAGMGEKIPFLSEAFDITRRRAGLHIELKKWESALPVGHFINKKIREGWPTDKIIVSSFHRGQLKKLRQYFPDIRLGVLYTFPKIGYTSIAKKLNAVSVHIPWQFTTKRLITEAREHDLKVFVYTANRKTTIKRLIRLGVDGIFTDYPDLVLEMRKTD